MLKCSVKTEVQYTLSMSAAHREYLRTLLQNPLVEGKETSDMWELRQELFTALSNVDTPNLNNG